MDKCWKASIEKYDTRDTRGVASATYKPQKMRRVGGVRILFSWVEKSDTHACLIVTRCFSLRLGV